MDLLLISSKFPIGVATIYRPFLRFVCKFVLIFIIFSCTPRIVSNEDISTKDNDQPIQKRTKQKIVLEETPIINQISEQQKAEQKILNEIEIILPINGNKMITKNFINSLELSMYKKNINNLSFNINTYSTKTQIQEIIKEKIEPGKIFIGPLTSSDTEKIIDWCPSDVIFFSFASSRDLAKDCIYLINFFPEDDLKALFNHFDSNSRIALLYPENQYGYYISKIIDNIAAASNSLIINKASYNENLSNAREAIKELSKYELRRYELERQKKLLKYRKDDVSKKALKKIEKYETLGELDFTHVIIPDHNIRLLQIVPLLPFYDIDPNKIQFVGTGVWDDEAFFNEPSLQQAIFPGVSKEKRKIYFDEYINVYNDEPIRTITLIHDLVGLISFFIENKHSINSARSLLNDQKISFDGIDGKFSFEDNLITRELEILQIIDGTTELKK